MSIIYVPRAGGSTLILTTGPSPTSPLPVYVVMVTFRDGVVDVEER